MCESSPVECNFCKHKVVRAQMKKHTETECGESIISCPYLKYGCEVKVIYSTFGITGKIKRANEQQHLEEDAGLHLFFAVRKYEKEMEQEYAERTQLSTKLVFQLLEQKTLILSLRAELQQLKEETMSVVNVELDYMTGLESWEKDNWIQSLSVFLKVIETAEYPPAFLRIYMIKEFTASKEEREQWREKSLKKLDWFKKAASSAEPRSRFNLAYCYFLNSDFPKAFETCEDASNRNYAPAQFLLGYLYFNGKGVPRNEDVAVELFTKSAKQGFAPAQYNLGKYYTLVENSELCIEWFKKAAEQGHAVAQYNLAVRYDYALETALALEWCQKSNEQGYPPAKDMLERLHKENQTQLE